jgi:hypothetical protein
VRLIDECIAARGHLEELEAGMCARRSSMRRANSEIADWIDRSTLQQRPFGERGILDPFEPPARRALRKQVDEERGPSRQVARTEIDRSAHCQRPEIAGSQMFDGVVRFVPQSDGRVPRYLRTIRQLDLGAGVPDALKVNFDLHNTHNNDMLCAFLPIK